MIKRNKVNDISTWTDKELDTQIVTLEHIIKRSKDRLKQLREEEHRRNNTHAYFSKDNEITRMLVNTGIIRKKRNNTNKDVTERQFVNSSIQGGM